MMRNLSFEVRKKEIRKRRLRKEDIEEENGPRQTIRI